MAERGQEGLQCSEKELFPSPAPQELRPPASPPRAPGALASLIASTWEQGAGGRGGTEVSRAQSSRPHSKPSQRTYWESHIESDAWQ